MDKKQILLTALMVTTVTSGDITASAGIRAACARVLQQVQEHPSVQRVTRTAQIIWNGTPLPIKKTARFIVNNPITSCVAAGLVSQAYLYTDVQLHDPADSACPVVHERSELEALLFEGGVRFLNNRNKQDIRDILERCGVTGIVVVRIGEKLEAPLPRLACTVGIVEERRLFFKDEKKCKVLILSPMAVRFLEGMSAKVRIESGDHIRREIYDRDGVLSVIHHEAAHMVLEHHKKQIEGDVNRYTITDATMSLQKLVAGAAMVNSLNLYRKDRLTLPRLAERGALLGTVLYGLQSGMQVSAVLMGRLQSRNHEWQADKLACYSTRLDELEAYGKVRLIWSQLEDQNDEGDEEDSRVLKFFNQAASTHSNGARVGLCLWNKN